MKHALFFSRFASLRVWLVLAGFALGVTNGPAAQYARGQLIPEVKLKNGTVLHDVTVVAVGSTTIVARWAGGMGSIGLAQLPPDMRDALAPSAPAPLAKPVQTSPQTPAASPLDPNPASLEIPTEIKLTNGFVMHRSSVTHWEANSVLVSYPGGIVSIRFTNIVPEQRAIFEARKDEALARQAKAEVNKTVVQDTAAHDEQVRQATEATAKDDAERKAEAINKGVSSHYLVKGMTKDQVKQAYGSPTQEVGDIFLYPSRGIDKYGNSADRQVAFQGGLLVGWRDQRDGEPAGMVDH